MPDTLDPIVADTATAGEILAALKLARWCLANPDPVVVGDAMPPAFYAAIQMIRSLVWDRVDDGGSCDVSQDHADAIAEAMGIAGILERVHAIEHLRRTRSDSAAYELTQAVGRQFSGAITSLSARLAESRAASN